MNKEFLNRLLTTPSVSGFEEPNQMNVIEYANGFAFSGPGLLRNGIPRALLGPFLFSY